MLLILSSYCELLASIRRAYGPDQYCFVATELTSGNIDEQVTYDTDCKYAALTYYADTKFNNVSVVLRVHTVSENCSFMGLCAQSQRILFS